MACGGPMACALIIINQILLAVGIAAFIVGAIAYWGAGIITKSVSIYTYISDTLGSDVDMKGLNIEDLLEPGGIMLMAFGAVIIIICIIGCCGAKHKNKCLLIIYATIVLIIVAAQIAVIVAFYGYSDTITDQIKDKWNETITKYYAGDNDTSTDYGAPSLFWAATNRYLCCCGVQDYWDFHAATNWNRGAQVIPSSCCVQNDTFPLGYPLYTSCIMTPNTTNSFYTTGCYTAVETLVKSPSQIMMYIVIGSMAVELCLAIFAICICMKEKGKDE